MKMKKYLSFMKYAFKEQRQYRTNFFASIGIMLFNDACFVVIFLIFLWYFTNTWLTFGNFMALFSLSCVWYWFVHGLLFNIWALSDVIEQWKLDYYLSFPVKPLNFIASNKIWVTDLWDIVFWLVCLLIYAFSFSETPALIVIAKWIWVLILSSLAMIWLYIMVGSVSFWLQRWGKIADLFNSTFCSFSQYPPEIYHSNRIVYILMCLLLFPSVILPYQMLIGESTIIERLLVIVLCLATLWLWIRVFNRWLKRYSSGNLVHQM